MIRAVRAGETTAVLPDTADQLRVLLSRLAAKRIRLPGLIINGFLKIRLRRLADHKQGEN